MMTGFERYTKKTRRAMFLEEMEQVVPWDRLCALIEPHYPTPGNGRRPKELEQMLRIYFLQQWFNLSDPAAEEALVIRECAPRARDFTQRRCRYKNQIVDEVAWAKNRTKSRVRAKVEHVFQVLKLKFGFVKVRYRGLKTHTDCLSAVRWSICLSVARS